jgi:hypothetical protein
MNTSRIMDVGFSNVIVVKQNIKQNVIKINNCSLNFNIYFHWKI